VLLLLQVMKVIAFSFNGVQPIDNNPAFVQDALAAGKKFITLCEAGGTMKPTVNFPLVRMVAFMRVNLTAGAAAVCMWSRQ
jgi:hypothetical protein